MAVKGKGKQIASKSQPPSLSPSTSSGKRKKVVADRGRRLKRRTGVLRFFDDVAQDADYDEDEEGEENEEDDDVDYEDEGVDLDFSKGGRSEGKDYKNYGKSHYLPFLVKEEELSGDELEELIRDRYGRGSEYVVYGEHPKEYNDDISVEHSAEDPNIWRVKCMIGREQQIVLSLMLKFADLQKRETKMDIISAFTLEHLKGYVYVEADKAFDVVEACKGFLNIYPSRMALVPQNEIPQLLTIRNTSCAISKGTWVRMKSGKYKGDLGQVVDYDAARRRATIKLVPRIDLQAIAKKYGGGISLKEAAVPAPRLISSHELERFRPHIETKRDRESGDLFEILDGLMLKDGYLYKKVSIASIVYWGVQPSKGELLKFKETSKAEVDVSWLSSVFNVNKKMKSSQAYDPKGTSEQGNGFNLHDLVLFGRKGFGVITDVGKDGIKILKGDAEGQEVMTVKIQDIKSNCVDKMFTASDRHRKTISINDVVKASDGPVEGRQGIVKHMYKGTLFIYDENQEENSGMFCSKSNFCENIAPQKNMGNKSSSSFNQSSEQEDGSRTFSMNRPSETNQTFSIGQTLRIRKGPLKGYLCRVVRIYRSDVTVKLDSLVKVITVEEQYLSIPNVRRDAPTEMPSDIFGAQERLTGGLSENGEQTMGTNSWDVGSWISFSTDNNKKTDQEQGADPWGSKQAPSAKEQEQGADPWGSKQAPAAKLQPQGADPWGSKQTPAAKVQPQGADSWGSKVSVASNGDSRQPNADSGQGADPWGNKVLLAVGDQGGADPWGSKLASGAGDKGKNADPWGSKTAFGDSSQSNRPLESWAKASSAGGSQDSSWKTAAGGGCEKDAGDGNNRTSATARGLPTSGKEQGADPWGSKVSLAARGQKQGADPWGSKEPLAAEGKKDADPWGSKLVEKARGQTQGADQWVCKEPLAGQKGADPWGSKLVETAREEKQSADPWGSNVAVASGDKEKKDDPWGSKVASGSSSHSNKALDSWAKSWSTEEDKGADLWGSKAAWTGSSHSNKANDSWGKAPSSFGGEPSNLEGFGRGGGRFGGRGGRDENNQGWGSRGRGGRGRFGYGDDSNQDNQGCWGSGRGRGRGRNEDSENFGRGRGWGRGRFQSSDRNNDQGNSGGEQSNWNRSKESGQMEKSSGWGGSKPSVGNEPSCWNAKESTGEKGPWDNWNAKKFSNGNQSKSSGWNSPTSGIGSSSKGEEGGWGSGSFNNEGAKKDDDGWGGKSTVEKGGW